MDYGLYPHDVRADRTGYMVTYHDGFLYPKKAARLFFRAARQVATQATKKSVPPLKSGKEKFIQLKEDRQQYRNNR